MGVHPSADDVALSENSYLFEKKTEVQLHLFAYHTCETNTERTLLATVHR
jgi:hypothetical protein